MHNHQPIEVPKEFLPTIPPMFKSITLLNIVSWITMTNYDDKMNVDIS